MTQVAVKASDGVVEVRAKPLAGIGDLPIRDWPFVEVAAGCGSKERLVVLSTQLTYDDPAGGGQVPVGAFWSKARATAPLTRMVLLARTNVDAVAGRWADDPYSTFFRPEPFPNVKRALYYTPPQWSVIGPNGVIQVYAEAAPGVAWTIEVKLQCAVVKPCGCLAKKSCGCGCKGGK